MILVSCIYNLSKKEDIYSCNILCIYISSVCIYYDWWIKGGGL